MAEMADMIYEYILYPIMAASGGSVSWIGIISKVMMFLLLLFAMMFGVPLIISIFG